MHQQRWMTDLLCQQAVQAAYYRISQQEGLTNPMIDDIARLCQARLHLRSKGIYWTVLRLALLLPTLIPIALKPSTTLQAPSATSPFVLYPR